MHFLGQFNSVFLCYFEETQDDLDGPASYLNALLGARLLSVKLLRDSVCVENLAQITNTISSLSTGPDKDKCTLGNCSAAISADLTTVNAREYTFDLMGLQLGSSTFWNGDTITVLSAWIGSESAVRTRLATGIHVDSHHPEFGGLLYAAAFKDDEPLARCLVGHGVDVSKQHGAYDTALQLAAYRGSERVARFLLSAGADAGNPTDASTGDGPYGSSLGAAASAGHTEIVRLLLERPNTRPNLGNSLEEVPLFLAAQRGREPVVRVLLERESVDPNAADDRGERPLLAAIENQHGSTVTAFLQRADVYLGYGSAEMTPLQLAIFHGDTGIIRLLLARPDLYVDHGKCDISPLEVQFLQARTPTQQDEFEKLLREHEGVHQLLRHNPLLVKRLLRWAAIEGDLGVARLFTEKFLENPNQWRDVNGSSALHAAVEYNQVEMVEMLLDLEDLDPDTIDHDWLTPLMRAKRYGHGEIVRLLEADPRVKRRGFD